MRTTLNIDSVVLEDLKRMQRSEGLTLGELASTLLAEAIARRQRRSVQTAPVLEWDSQPMHALVDLEDKDALYSKLEEDV